MGDKGKYLFGKNVRQALVEFDGEIEHAQKNISLPRRVDGLQLFNNCELEGFEFGWFLPLEKAQVIKNEFQIIGRSVLQFGLYLFNNISGFIRIKHGESPYVVIRRADIIFSSLRCGWFTAVVRAASVLTHTFSPLYFELWGLAGLLLFHLLDFILRIGSVLQIKLKSAKDFAIERSPIILGSLFYCSMQSFIGEPEICGYHKNSLALS
jgi:hypothetical protein